MILVEYIKETALDYSIVEISPARIDEINILQARYESYHQCIDKLTVKPEYLLVDGNRFKTYPGIPHECVVRGDATYQAIAAASILAKTHRDDIMDKLHEMHPQYGWNSNRGYGSKGHLEVIRCNGTTPEHRMSYAPCKPRMKTMLDFMK